MKFKVKIAQWSPTGLYSAYAVIRKGSLETGNYKTPALARRAFRDLCGRLGIPKNRYEFVV